MKLGEYEIIDESEGFALLKNPDGRGTVVEIDRNRGQVYNAMPGDSPKEGGTWFARISGAGVDYVASWYSWRYARRMFRQCITEKREWQST